MSKTVYLRTGITGGTATDLDGIDGDNLLDADMTFVTLTNVLYPYLLDDDSGAVESSPDIIAPDTNPGNKRWLLQTPVYAVDTTGTPADDDFAKFTDANTIEGRSYAEVKSDLNLEIGTDVLAQQTIGIADDNLLEVDGTPLDTEVAVFTAAGINGLSESEFKAAFNLEIGTDVLAQQTIGIANDNLLEVDGTPLDTEVAVFTAAGINGLSESEFKAAFNMEAGTDYLAQQTIGIANDNLLEVDGTPLDTEVAVFTAAGINGLSESEFKAAFNLEIGTDVLAQQTIGIADDNLLEVDQADAANGEYTRMTANGIESRSKLETQADLCVPIDASNTDVDTGTETVDSFADTTGDVCFWFVKVKKGANVRAQIFMANWDASGDTIEYSQGQTTLDVGDTSDLVLSADIDSNNIRLRATAGSDDWEVTVKRMVV